MTGRHRASDENLVDELAKVVYAAGLETEWLTTVDGTPNVFSYHVARAVAAALTLVPTPPEEIAP